MSPGRETNKYRKPFNTIQSEARNHNFNQTQSLEVCFCEGSKLHFLAVWMVLHDFSFGLKHRFLREAEWGSAQFGDLALGDFC